MRIILNMVCHLVMYIRSFKNSCSVASMANGYSTWRWVSKDNLKFKLIMECSFFDNKFLCKEKKLRLSES